MELNMSHVCTATTIEGQSLEPDAQFSEMAEAQGTHALFQTFF